MTTRTQSRPLRSFNFQSLGSPEIHASLSPTEPAESLRLPESHLVFRSVPARELVKGYSKLGVNVESRLCFEEEGFS
ncbi:predicted protein [Verticillium alfalfae VaMs.102]|uniref:Predicted protein n=1 Tax=Verticillium alfalfae (strain VaMs.102 / ATCC MYA-4576 / FGSC 10136) TaxID=526221 RepID=C9SYS8_VERA1|nr:predicted protein [Verticillium alfalfae VaMs.102]EEY23943.1 predicted protein [Verticillium alfalfae VaMs.102]